MRLHRILAALVALAVVIGGCSSTDRDDRAADTADAAGEQATAETYATESTGAGASGDADGAAVGADGQVTDVEGVDLEAVPIAAVDRRIVYTGTTSAVVDEVGAAVRAAQDVAAAEGGYVFAQDLTAEHARVVLKVPVDRFDAVFDAVVGIGEVADQHIEAEDVTERFVDLESRQATLATSIDRIRGFLAEATNVDEISRLESELTNREAEHDVIAGQLRVLRDRTSYGTITAEFRVDERTSATVLEDDAGSGPPGFGEGLSTGWDAVTTAAAAVATVAGFALPFSPVLLAVAMLIWWRRRPRPAVPAQS